MSENEYGRLTEGVGMGLIQCPECGAKISDRAVACPHCGYSGEDSLMPISAQASYEVVPTFKYEIESWNPEEVALSPLPFEDNKALVQFFGDWDKMKVALPSLAEAVKQMADSEHVLVAKMSPYIKKLIKEGSLQFQLDKNGEMMAVLKDAETQKWAKQLRLEDMELSPNVAQSLNHLTDMAMMGQILNEIESVGDAIKRIHVELQDDRIALAESAWDKLMQARKIQDARLREAAVLNALQAATESKRILMRSFTRSREFIEENADRTSLQMLKETGKRVNLNTMAADAFQDLVSITNVVRIECEGYTMIGEYDAASESLKEFDGFIKANKLNDRDTLLLLNGALKQKRAKVVNEFCEIASQIEQFQSRDRLEGGIKGLFEPSDVESEQSDEQE